MTAVLTIEAAPLEPLVVNLVGVKYTIPPMKLMSVMSTAAQFMDPAQGNSPEVIAEGMSAITKQMFGKKNSRKILDRLNDPEDPLDITHIVRLVNALIERSTGNPTT